MGKTEIKYVPQDMRQEEIKDRAQRERVEALYDLTIRELIERFDKSTEKTTGNVLNKDYYDIPIVLQHIFHIATPEEVNDSIESIIDRIEELEAKFRNHRHPLNELYSAKPEF